MSQHIMQARSSTNGQLYTWQSASPDYAASGYTGPGTAQEIAVLARPIGASPGAGSGDVVGPVSSVDNAVARYHLTTGKIIQNSLVIVDDSGNIATPGTVDGVDVSTLPGSISTAQAAAQSYADTLFLGSEITPTALAANTNNWAPTGLSGSTEIRVSASSAFDLTGISASVSKRVKLLTNVGANTITLKDQSGSSSAANQFLVSSGADYALQAKHSVWIYYDSTTQRWRVTPAGSGGGGGENLAATLAFGSSAGGSGISDLGILSSAAELTLRQAANDILRTASGTTILRTVSAAIVLRKGANDIAQFGETAAVQSELLFAAVQPAAFISALAPATGPGVTLSIRAGAPGGAGAQAGGRVRISGTAPLGAGAVGGVDVYSTAGSLLAAFDNAVTAFHAPLVRVANALNVHGTGTGTAVATTAVLCLPADTTQIAVKRTSGGDIAAVRSSGTGISYGDPTQSTMTTVDSATEVRASIGGSPKFRVLTGFIQSEVNVISFAGTLGVCEYNQGRSGSGAGGEVRYSGQGGQSSGNTDGGWATLVGGLPNGSGLKGGFRLAMRNVSNVPEYLIGGYEPVSGHNIVLIGANHTAPTSGTFPTPGNGVIGVKAIDKTTVGTPPAGWVYLGFDTTTKQLFSKNDVGTVHDYT